MIQSEFWNLIGKLDWDQVGLDWDQVGDDKAIIDPVVNLLVEKQVDEIYQFEEILARNLYALDTENHAKEIGEGAYMNISRPMNFFMLDVM